jgi:hypothetical protein
MNEARKPKKILDMELKGKLPRGRQKRKWEQEYMSEEEHGQKLRRSSFEKTRDG